MEKEDISPQLEFDGKVGIVSVTDGVVDAISYNGKIWVPLKEEPVIDVVKEEDMSLREKEIKIQDEEDYPEDRSQVKMCSNCGEVKPISGFYKDKSKSDGLQSWCKDCMLEYTKKYKKNGGVHKCNKCGVELIVKDNWYPSSKKYGRYVCKDCEREYQREKRAKKVVSKAKLVEPIKISEGEDPLVKVDTSDRKSDKVKTNWHKFKNIFK